jgi:hypothetical protein
MKPNVIASRVLYDLRDPNKKFVVEIFSPAEAPDTNGSWRCEVRIIGGPDGLHKMFAGGNDSYQALTSALTIIQAMVYRLNEEVLNGNLRFLEDADLDLHLKVINS